MTQYEPQLKAQVMAALLTGQSVSSVAREYSVPRTTVINWRDQAGPTVLDNCPTAKKEIGDLLLIYLRTAIVTLTVQQRVFADEDWLKKQPASELAVLHGVTADKAIRLLEALGGDDEPDAEVSALAAEGHA